MITPKVHGNWDYLLALFFLAAPSLFTLSQAGIILCYALAIIHFLMTISTKFPMGLIKLIPLKGHGYVELAVGILLIVIPWIFAGLFSKTGVLLFTISGVIIIFIWFVSDFQIETNKNHRQGSRR